MSSVGAPTPEFGKLTPEVLTTPLSSLGYKKQLQASRINAVSNLQSFSQAGRHGSSTVFGSNLLPSWNSVVYSSQWSVLCSVYSRCPVDSTDDYVGRLRLTSSLCPSSTVRRLRNSHNQMKVVTAGHSQRGRRPRLTAESRFHQVRRRPGSRELLLSCIHTPTTQSRDILAIRTVTKSRGEQSHWCFPAPTASPQ